MDRNLQFQQNLESFAITIVVLCAKNNRRNTLKAFIPRIFDTLAERIKQTSSKFLKPNSDSELPSPQLSTPPHTFAQIQACLSELVLVLTFIS